MAGEQSEKEVPAPGCPGSYQHPKNRNLFPGRGQCKWCLDWFPLPKGRSGQLAFHRSLNPPLSGATGAVEKPT